MSESIQPTLTSAFEMIEQGHPDRAVTVLQPLLTQAADNPDVWWVYAHAVSDPQVAHAALTRVLRLEPGYPEAVTLLRRLERQLRAQRANLMRERPPATALSSRSLAPNDAQQAPATDLPELPITASSGGCMAGSINLLLVMLAIGLIAVVALLALEPQLNSWLSRTNPEPDQDSGNSPIIRTWVPTAQATAVASPTVPTAVVGIPTLQTTAVGSPTVQSTAVISPTTQTTAVVSPTLQSTALSTSTPPGVTAGDSTPGVEQEREVDIANSANEALQPPPLPRTPASSAVIMPDVDLAPFHTAVPEIGSIDPTAILMYTAGGWNVVLPACGVEGDADSIPLAQEYLAELAAVSADLPPDIQAIAIELIDCTSQVSWLTLSIERAVAQKYAAGGMNETALRARMQRSSSE